MADGSTKPIGDLQPGDVVTATDPQTGETAEKAITHKTVTPNDSRFTDLTLAKDDGNGTPGPETELTSTAHHPYWDDTTHRWTAAEDLRPGDQLTTPDHGHVTVVSGRTYDTPPQTADNLSVDDLHTYYVVTDDTPVLVHNWPAGRGRGGGARPDRLHPSAGHLAGEEAR
ncbi:polymorphic toxin-type HINT domain-containing protein [Kitasatospora sp. SUK 42]|uniref:polymorphic toxin-type HINT domain-containing protein n=1 Tax=Kitasatospora sp. SUK 42 TaxID=1588882 RepID=UPI0018CB6BA9|nr:polymorphic toxin-type HINT domain-containing protein [Kitasatospora sp. SUK 42]MBV2155291.1 HINT domain-containing protein [Kitasatospora sp. SUK 42]